MVAETPLTSIPNEVTAYLEGHRVLNLATASAAGVPHATALLYVLDGHDFLIWTRPGTVTARHIDENPSVAFTIGDDTADWSATKGVQASGECKVLLNPGAIEAAAAKFDDAFPGLLPERRQALSFYRIRPYQLHFIDNAQRPGEDAAAFHRDLVYSVFTDLPRGQVQAVEARLDQISVPAGEVVVRQGAPADKFFIIVEGGVEVVRSDDGVARVVATLGAGQFFGEIAILQDSPRTATVRTIAPSTLLTMDRSSFRSLVAQSLSTTQNLDELIRQRMEALGSR